MHFPHRFRRNLAPHCWKHFRNYIWKKIVGNKYLSLATTKTTVDHFETSWFSNKNISLLLENLSLRSAVGKAFFTMDAKSFSLHEAVAQPKTKDASSDCLNLNRSKRYTRLKLHKHQHLILTHVASPTDIKLATEWDCLISTTVQKSGSKKSPIGENRSYKNTRLETTT